jgi:predicted transcriptional regulator
MFTIPATFQQDKMSDIDRIDELIIGLLNKSGKPVSTYKIAKETKLAWSTINIHCYKLKSLGLMDETTQVSHIGQKKVMWKLTAKTPTLDKFMKK